MNALERRIAALEAQLTPQPAHEIIVAIVDVDEAGIETLRSEQRSIGRVPGPNIKVRVVRAAAQPFDESYPQADAPVDKSQKPQTIIELEPKTIIELEPGDDLNAVALELCITADELQRQIQAGLVRILDPLPAPPSLTAHIEWN